MDQRSGLAQQIPTGLEKTFLHSKQTAAKHFARLETENGTDPLTAPRRRSKHLHRIDMTPTPGPPYEWDEDKRHHNIEMHGVDFTLVDRANWPAAAHRRSAGKASCGTLHTSP